MGLETDTYFSNKFGAILNWADKSILILFSFELMLKFYVYRVKFFHSGWNIFDLFIVIIAWLPTSGALTVTLPASPSAGDIVAIVDYAGTADTNNITVARNSSNINGGTDNLTISSENSGITLVGFASREKPVVIGPLNRIIDKP